MDTIKVHITEDDLGHTVRVEYEGQVHRAVWPDDKDMGDLEQVVGDANLLSAALYAWSGEDEFEITPEELAEEGGGYWAPPSAT